MGLFTSWFRAKWKHPDAEVRLQAVQGMDEGDQKLLAGIAERDDDPRVRALAAGKVTDIQHLQPLAERGDDAVKRIARERLSGAADRLLRAGTWAQAGPMLGRVTDAKSLADLTLHASDREIRSQAFAKLLASGAGLGLLETIAVQDPHGDLGRQVIERLERRSLKDVARKAKAAPVREAAAARLTALDSEERKPSGERRRQERLADLRPLVERAVRLAVATDWARVAVDLERLEGDVAAVHGRYADLAVDPEADQLSGRINRAIRDTIARRSEAEAQAEQARAARQALIDEASSGDASPERAVDLARRWGQLALWPGEAAEALGRTFQSAIERHRPVAAGATTVVGETAAPAVAALPDLAPAVSERLAALLTEAEALATAGNRHEAKFRYQVLHKELDTLLSGVPLAHPAGRAAKDRFTAAFLTYKDRGRAERAERDQRRAAQIARAEELIAEAIRLAADPAAEADVAARVLTLKNLQAEFRSCLAGQRPDAAGALRERMQPAMDAAWLPLKSYQEAEDWNRFQQLAKADELTHTVEALAQTEDPTLVLRGLKQAQAAWRNLGPLPRAKSKTAWEAFKAACDVQYARLKPWFAEQDAARAENLTRKQALLTEAEALAADAGKTVGLVGSPADLQAKRQATERMKALQENWKEIGPVPRENDDEIWRRWRAVGDTFWKAHKAELAIRDQSHGENLTKKQALIAAAEQLAETAERAKATGIVTSHDIIRRIKDLQAQWKDIGHVPRDQVEPIWQAWKAVLDRCWATVKDHTDAIAGERAANQAKKEALIAEAETIAAGENARWFKEDVKALIRQWRDIGPIDRDKADELELRFRTTCDKVLKAEG